MNFYKPKFTCKEKLFFSQRVVTELNDSDDDLLRCERVTQFKSQIDIHMKSLNAALYKSHNWSACFLLGMLSVYALTISTFKRCLHSLAITSVSVSSHARLYCTYIKAGEFT